MNDRLPRGGPQHQNDKDEQRDKLLLLLFFITFSILVFSLLQNVQNQKKTSDELPLSLHSVREADYSRDHEFLINPSFNLRILRDIFIDQGLEDDAINSRLETLTAVLLSPIPTATGTLSVVNTPMPVWTQTPLPTPVLSNTAAPTPVLPLTPAPTKNVPPPSTPDPPAPNLKLELSLGTHFDNDFSGTITLNDGLTYKIKLTNTGTAALSSVYVVDVTFAIPVTCPGNSLAAGASMLCTTNSPHVVTLAESNAGKVTMTAFASGDHNGSSYSQTTSLNTSLTQNPSVSLVKSLASYIDDDSSGSITQDDRLWYQFDVTNTGYVTVSNLSITDDSFGLPVACPPVSLAPGTTVTCNATSTHIVTAGEVIAGEVTNTATASVDFNTATYTDSDTLVIPLSVQLVKSLNYYVDQDTSGTVTLGDDLWYQFDVTNIGTLTLNNISVTDDTFGISVTCLPTTLLPGASTTCTADTAHTITLAEANNGNVQNQATVTGDPPASPTVRDSSIIDTPVIQNAALSISKNASLPTYDAPGQIIDYTFLVSNTGNVTISGPITVDDDKTTNEFCPAGNIDPGNSITCTASHTITQLDLDSGSVTNTAYATGTGPGGNPVASAPVTISVPAIQTPAIQIVKVMASYGDLDASNSITLGDALWYRFTVTNAGNVTLNPVSVTDNSFSIPVTCPQTSLAPGASMLCVADTEHTITLSEANAGQVSNTATASGVHNGTPYATSDTITTPVTQNPAFTLLKVADAASVSAPGTVNYTISIDNTGNISLTGASISDPLLGSLAGPGGDTNGNSELDVNETWTYSGSYTVTQLVIDGNAVSANL